MAYVSVDGIPRNPLKRKKSTQKSEVLSGRMTTTKAKMRLRCGEAVQGGTWDKLEGQREGWR